MTNMKSFIGLMMVYITSLLLCSHVTQASLAKPGCQEKCGNLTIPYPYGIGTNCFSHKSFEVLCDGSAEDIAPLRFVNNHEFPILEISTESVRVTTKVLFARNNSGLTSVGKLVQLDQYFQYSHDQNVYIGVGCNCYVTVPIISLQKKSVCTIIMCDNLFPSYSSYFNCIVGNGCCQRSIAVGTTAYSVQHNFHTLEPCIGAFVTEKSDIRSLLSDTDIIINFSVALNWVIALHTCREAQKRGDSLCGQNSHCIDSSMGIGYNCRCNERYEGNPYLPTGCQGARKKAAVLPKGTIKILSQVNCHYDTCEHIAILSTASAKLSAYAGTILTAIGLSALSAFGCWVSIEFARRNNNRMRRKFFERNGGRLLKQKISGNNSRVMKIKIYDVEELEKATDGFSRHRFLGKGGQGTVYKGLLLDGTVVAIKKLKMMDDDEAVRFVNEVLILAHISHRNIVKLLGCCLEYEVPLLVYEYLSNGTLSQHLHDGFKVFNFLWKDRVRIAREVAEALAYLHSYASPTIFHRDIKPGNILLDKNYNAVVADFGLSRSVALSKTHLTTQIEGTFGYLDPEYFQSGKLTAKSDVYAFGVILTELLTKRKAVSSLNSGEGLVPQFQYLIKHNLVISILDMQVVQEARMDDILLLAKLANRCMKKNAKKRPNMKEVVAHLDKLKVVQLEFPQKCITDDDSTSLESILL